MAREQPVDPRRPATHVGAALSRKVLRRLRSWSSPEQPVDPLRPAPPIRASLSRKLLRRMRSPSAVRAAALGASPPPPPDVIARELHAESRSIREPPAARTPDRPRLLGEMTASAPAADQLERLPPRSKVVEFEALTQQRTVRLERTVRPDRPLTAAATRPPATEPPHAELLLDVGTERVREQAIQRPVARLESSLEAGRRDERLSADGIDMWPDLPPPLDRAGSEVEVAGRAWERQQRLDREQTRL